jgi:hypothetical protein
MAPLTIIVVYGIAGIFSDPNHERLLSKMKTKTNLNVYHKSKKGIISQRHKIIHFMIILTLVVSLAASVYPSHRGLDESYEEITIEDVNAIEWIGNNLDKNTTNIASDHRLERMIEANGFNTTKDDTSAIWTTTLENMSDCINELFGIGKNYSRITHIFIDDIIKEQGVHLGYSKDGFMTLRMTDESYEKFQPTAFQLVYRNATIDPDTSKVVHWAEVYKVNWTYFESSDLN